MKKADYNLAARIVAIRELPSILLFAGLFVYFALRAPGFADPADLADRFRQYVPQAMLAVALTLIIGSGGIDISVGSVLGLCAVVLGAVTLRGVGAIHACLLALATGCAIGAFNGLAVARIRLQPVVVTLSTWGAARGLCYVIAGRNTSMTLPPTLSAFYESPATFALAIAVTLTGVLILRYSTLGRAILAVGSSEEAARFSGINVAGVKLKLYTFAGGMAGLAAIVTSGWMNTASTEAGKGYEFEAITAVLIGGTSIYGGEATVIGSMFGVAAVAILSRGFGLMAVSEHWQRLFLGLILIASVLLDRLRRSYESRVAGRKKPDRHSIAEVVNVN